jgi:hypothetical protein
LIRNRTGTIAVTFASLGHRKIRIKETSKDSDGRINPAFMKAYFEALDRAAPKIPREKTFYWLADQ